MGTDCQGPSTIVRNPTYAVLSRNQLCRELRAHWGGVAKKWRMMTRGRGGVTIPPKIDDVIYEQPLSIEFVSSSARLWLPESHQLSLQNLLDSRTHQTPGTPGSDKNEVHINHFHFHSSVSRPDSWIRLKIGSKCIQQDQSRKIKSKRKNHPRWRQSESEYFVFCPIWSKTW